MKRYLYIYNPFSGTQSSAGDLDSVLGKFYSEGIHVIPHRLYTMKEDTVLDSLLADTEHFDGVIILGGDGTVGRVIDKLIKYDNHIPVGIIPGGTCNDFAHNLKMPTTIAECLDIFCQGRVEEVDLLKITAGETVQYICNSIAAGIFTGVSHSTSPELKKVFGSFAYYVSALADLTDIKPFHITVETPEETVETDSLVFVILNGTDVGGMKNFISDAELRDGRMNIMVVKNCGPVDRAAVGLNILSRKNDKNLISITAPSCTVTVDKDLPVSVDGEYGLPLPYHIETIKRGLKVFVPEAFNANED